MREFGCLAEPIPRTKGAKIWVCHESKKIAQCSDIELAVMIAVGHLKFSFEKVQ